MVISIFTVGSFFGFFDAASLQDRASIEYLVKSGDTLWDIAGIFGNEITDIRQTVYEICKLNDITPETLTAGTTIRIPTK